jgi:hypothetical protein
MTGIWQRLRMRQVPLEFTELSDHEQDRYMELVNAIDTRLLNKFLKSLPLRAVSLIVSGGLMLPVSGVMWLYRLGKKEEAKDAVKKYVKRVRRHYWRRYVNWNSFPSAHVALGGRPLPNPNPCSTCPICKHYSMQSFIVNDRREVLRCDSCKKCMVVTHARYTGGLENFVIPGFYAVAIPASAEIADVLSNVDIGGSIADVLSSVVDLF